MNMWLFLTAVLILVIWLLFRRSSTKTETPEEVSVKYVESEQNDLKGFELTNTITMDLGRFSIKSGILKSNTNDAIDTRSVIGQIKDPARRKQLAIRKQEEFLVGNEAVRERSIVGIRYPLIESNFCVSDYRLLLKSSLPKYLLKSSNKNIIVATNNDMHVDQKGEICRLLVEDMDVRFERIMFVSQPTCILASRGLVSGLVVDCGHHDTRVTPVYESCSIPGLSKSGPVGGKVLSDILNKLILDNQGKNWTSSTELDILHDIKKKLCYVTMTPNSEIVTPQRYILPDRTAIDLGEERYQTPEYLFDPFYNTKVYNPLDQSALGVHRLAHNVLQKIDPDFSSVMYNNIVLTGGSSMFEGFDKRFCDEFGRLANKPSVVRKIPTNIDNDKSVWLGAALLSTTQFFEKNSFTPADYNEQGANIIERMCFM
ncbi:actin [Acrasis kona]|uniref:Actin n=1 Tax=Acrasis kona TaxID=1008807 RepID=A0AAW2Z1U7_9EUKA